MARVIEGFLTPPQGRFALCVSRFNGFITEQLLRGAQDALLRHGVAEADIDVFRVPGTFELPGLVRRVAEAGQYAGVVALGCVIRGGTPHFEYVAGEAASGLQLAALETGIPVSFGVLTVESSEQADARIDKAADAVRAALEMADLFAQIRANAVQAG